MGFLDLLDGVIRKPAETMNLIAREKPVGWALAIFVVSALLGAVAMDHAALEGVLGPIGSNMVFSITGSLIGLFIITGALHLLSRIFKGSGDYWGLLSALGFAQFPGVLAPVAELVKNMGGAAAEALGGLFSFGLGIWVLALCVIALRESYGLTTGTSVLTYLIALAVLVAIAAVGIAGLALILGGII